MPAWDEVEFSFADGGAIVNHLRKLGLLGRGRLPLVVRIALAVAITWLPILILTAYQGVAFGDKVRIPFLSDSIQYSRFLVALPLAIWAEVYISSRYEIILNRFLNAGVVWGPEVPKFKKAISLANSLKDSVIVELLIIALVYLYMSFRLERDSLTLSSWNPGRFGQASNSLAEQWYFFVSMPVFLFFWVRWLWRHGVWAYLLFRISMLKLRLISTHPDSAGGLTFISTGHRRYAVLFFSISAILCASITNEIVFAGADLRSFELELTTFFLICLSVALGPLLVFTPALIRAKLRDIGTYGVFSAIYTQDFDDKWIQERGRAGESSLGSPDIQSLADMQNSYKEVASMRTILPDKRTIIILFIAYLLPVVPLLTTIIPLRQILSEILKLLQG